MSEFDAREAREVERGTAPTDAEMRENVVRLVFRGDRERYDAFLRALSEALPPDTAVVLRGSAVTGYRWSDGEPFDAEGPGTSDLDLTFVGESLLEEFTSTGFFVPGVHSRPLSDDDPDIAPGLLPLRERLMSLVNRPVNIQATRDAVMTLRGEMLGQPYLVLLDRVQGS
ncbi:MAG TPA: hypothetical protein VF198_04495 [Vicinamibacterales bacterium]